MTTLAFLAALAVIFIIVLAMEGADRDTLGLHRPAGLLAWLTGGNWPAKIGGALIVVGVGALLRYALLNIDLPAQLKLASGIVIALALGLASTFVPAGPARRPVSLALGGAAFGVVYLTAYSAFGLFGYLSSPIGLALLAAICVAAGVYAVTRSAQSLAVLAISCSLAGSRRCLRSGCPTTRTSRLRRSSRSLSRPTKQRDEGFFRGGGCCYAGRAHQGAPRPRKGNVPPGTGRYNPFLFQARTCGHRARIEGGLS